jgi:hypothetical protein
MADGLVARGHGQQVEVMWVSSCQELDGKELLERRFGRNTDTQLRMVNSLQFGAEYFPTFPKDRTTAVAASEPSPDQKYSPASTGLRNRTRSPGEEALPVTMNKRKVTEIQ